jgi:hypothetical protein
MNKLAVIAFGGLAISAVCLGAAAAIGARHHGSSFDFTMFDDSADCKATDTTATATARSFPWDGGDEVTIEVPANLHYRPGPGTTLEARGDPQMLANLTVKNGKVAMSCRGVHWHHQRLDITLPGREFREFHIAGVADLDLQQLNQTTLKIEIAGSGDVTATGRLDDLKLEIAGRGDAHLKDLAVKSLKLEIAGRGDVETSPQDSADIDIAGSGDVKLYTEPKHINTSIMGRGDVEHLAGKS